MQKTSSEVKKEEDSPIIIIKLPIHQEDEIKIVDGSEQAMMENGKCLRENGWWKIKTGNEKWETEGALLFYQKSRKSRLYYINFICRIS